TEIRDWHDVAAEPRLEGLKLFFPADRAQWVEDISIPPATVPQAFVEFFGGDRLPGRVIEYRNGQESIYRKSPPSVVVLPDAAVDWPDTKRHGGLPVVARFLRRVVWQKRDEARYRPATLFYRDGRQIAFRSLRWSKTSVRLLVEQETRDVPFDAIAELHLPKVDPWEAWFQLLAALLPDLSGFIIQVETGDGLRATASSRRFLPAFRGDAGNPDHWYQAVQPFWSTELLWLKHRMIRVRRFFLPHEVPLSAIEPARVVQRSHLAGGWNWQVDRSVHGDPQRSGDLAFGWGLGVQAYSELAFDLPPCARTFRTHYGLDWTAGTGGCVRAAIFAGTATGQLLHRSEHVIGTAKTFDTGPLPVTGAKQLTLVVDPAQDDRPPGADPFEIRDSFDWLQPVVELDLESLRQEVDRRIESPQWGWAGWTLAGLPNKPCMASIAWDHRAPPARGSRVEIAPRDTFLALTRRMEIGQRDRFLVLSVNRLEKETGPSRIQVRMAGSAVAEFDVPIFNTAVEPDPLVVPIERFRGSTVDAEIVQISQTPQSRVEWRGIGTSIRDPIVFEGFEDDPAFVDAVNQGTGQGALDMTEKYAGTGSLFVTPQDRNNPSLPGWNLAIRAEPHPGEFRYLRFAWKKHGGNQLGLHLAQHGEFAPTDLANSKESRRYEGGRETTKDYGLAIRLRDQPLNQWQTETRDLWADFGPVDVSGLRFVCGDGEAAWFDHIYFARTPQDLDRVSNRLKNPPPDPIANLPPDLKANIERAAVEPARFGEVLSQVAPAFSTAASDQGVRLLKTFQGKQRVVRTHPQAQGQPCILRAAVAVPAGKKTELRMTVAPHPQADWQLLVFANGEKLHEALVAATATAPEGWTDVVIDLSRFAGRNMLLEVHNHPNNWASEFAYWQRLEVVVQ
ncbi:MAG TPA: NPCBM/NEW2 domain-containing protein, partial [Planctomycetaceae bacterium]